MKKLIFISIICCSILSCKKDCSNNLTEITITGMDLTMRPCSGGYNGKIGNELVRTFDLVENSVLKEDLIFPKTFLIKYERPSGGCYDEKDGVVKIKVTEIKNK